MGRKGREKAAEADVRGDNREAQRAGRLNRNVQLRLGAGEPLEVPETWNGGVSQDSTWVTILLFFINQLLDTVCINVIKNFTQCVLIMFHPHFSNSALSCHLLPYTSNFTNSCPLLPNLLSPIFAIHIFLGMDLSLRV